MIAAHISDKWLVTIIYERLSKLNNKRMKELNKIESKNRHTLEKIYGSKSYENIFS